MKGFKDSSGKFHPITDYKGVRKSRDQSAKTEGVKIRKARTDKSFGKLFEIKSSSLSDERNEREFDRFTSSITDFGSGDIASAVEKADEVGIRGSELADIVREFGDDTGTPLNDIDVVAVLYDHILQNARNEINSVLGFDIQNDADFYVAGNYLATTYDYSSESNEDLKGILMEATRDELERLSRNIFVKSFLTDVDVF